MSEYQYYEFRALDRPLSDEQMEELSDISTRAKITRTSFVNEYNYGDLKAKPLDMVKRYFDAHLYYANWGTVRLMFKMPRKLLDLKAARLYCKNETVSVTVHNADVIVTLEYQEEEPDFEDSARDWLDDLLPIRQQLMRGDLRSLYIAWLASIWEDSEDVEPPVPAGLGESNKALECLADILCVDPHLVAAAGQASEKSSIAEPTENDLLTWLQRFPNPQKDVWLASLITGDPSALQTSRELWSQFQKDWNEEHSRKESRSTGQRTAADLYRLREPIAAAWDKREAENAAKAKATRERKAAADRKVYLETLLPTRETIWPKLKPLMESSSPKKYDDALQILQELREISAMTGESESWSERILEYRRVYGRRRMVMKRFDKAAFPK